MDIQKRNSQKKEVIVVRNDFEFKFSFTREQAARLLLQMRERSLLGESSDDYSSYFHFVYTHLKEAVCPDHLEQLDSFLNDDFLMPEVSLLEDIMDELSKKKSSVSSKEPQKEKKN